MTGEAAWAGDFGREEERNLSSCHELCDLGKGGMERICNKFVIGTSE